jgi:hypothetical protein
MSSVAIIRAVKNDDIQVPSIFVIWVGASRSASVPLSKLGPNRPPNRVLGLMIQNGFGCDTP